MPRLRWLALTILLSACTPTFAQQPLTEALVLPLVGRYGRAPVYSDLLQAEIVAGRWKEPKEGDKLPVPGGSELVWKNVKVGKDGWLSDTALRGGYACWIVPSDTAKIMMLEASGHLNVQVNGEPRVGDPYENGYVRVPVQLQKGSNLFLFQGGRGRVRARLVEAPAQQVFLSPADWLLPDLREGDASSVLAAAVVINASTKPTPELFLVASLPEDGKAAQVALPKIPPLSVRKVAINLPEVVWKKGTVDIRFTLQQGGKQGSEVWSEARHKLRVRGFDESYRRTFRSRIDGSVQYYAVQPTRPPGEKGPRPALFLTLHGAGVEALGQADSYAPKSWGHIVAPTNRRPFGFDWEDWGRLDAIEVLELASKELRVDPQRVYLTGHSMGGHGVWHLGATYPSRFAAIGPSAGWATFWTYGAGPRPEPKDERMALLRRAANTSDTLALAPNTTQHGVYILHGEADDNVPVSQARLMRKVLEPIHRDLRWHEEKGAGHWWDKGETAGVDCVDWGPLFDFFGRRVIPRLNMVRQVDFSTVNPGVSAWCHWAGIEGQIKQLELSRVQLRLDPVLRRFSGTTENVARLALVVAFLQRDTIEVELDGQKLKHKDEGNPPTRLHLARADGKWKFADPPPKTFKGPHRYGPFREAFNHNMLLVYGTHGNVEENAWSFAKARYDAETFWYRGNGSVEVTADRDFEPKQHPDRSVILYGNAETNAAWPLLLRDCPIEVKRGVVRVGERQEKGDLGCLFLRPRADSERACVGVIGGSGLAGMRLTDRLPLFVSGAAQPDWVVLGPEMLTEGYGGVRGCGYFGLDWNVQTGEAAWRK